MEVRIVEGAVPAASAEADYVRVSAWCDPEQDTVTLATIERIVHKPAVGQAKGLRIKTLLAEHPMSPDDALGLARSYAERKQIPLVLSDIRAQSAPPDAGNAVSPRRTPL